MIMIMITDQQLNNCTGRTLFSIVIVPLDPCSVTQTQRTKCLALLLTRAFFVGEAAAAASREKAENKLPPAVGPVVPPGAKPIADN